MEKYEEKDKCLRERSTTLSVPREDGVFWLRVS